MADAGRVAGARTQPGLAGQPLARIPRHAIDGRAPVDTNHQPAGSGTDTDIRGTTVKTGGSAFRTCSTSYHYHSKNHGGPNPYGAPARATASRDPYSNTARLRADAAYTQHSPGQWPWR